MHVTIVDGDVPYPANSGKRLRSLNLVLPLAERHRITYIARCQSSAEGDAAAAFLRSKGIAPIMVHAPLARKSGVMFYGRLAANLVSTLPYAIATHQPPEMRAAVEAHLAKGPVDLWQVEWLGYLHAVAGLPGCKVLTAHNVESLIWRRYAETEAATLKRAFVREQWRKMVAYERQAFQSVDRVVTVSDEDARCARDLYGKIAASRVDNGVDADFFSGIEADLSSRQILFLGALDWRPNLDAVEIMIREVMPQVLAAAPNASLCVVGRSPPAWLADLIARSPGITLNANVPDVRPFMAQSAMMAVPLRIGGGSRLKIIEALAARLPVASSAIGAEGLHLEAGVDFDLADTPAEMARAILKRLNAPAPVSAETLAKIVGTYDWRLLAGCLEQVWIETVAQSRGFGVKRDAAE